MPIVGIRTSRSWIGPGTGVNTKASGQYALAMGRGTRASGYGSTASGYGSTASGSYSTASGYNSLASGNYSTALSNYSTASGYSAVVFGDYSTASGYASTASGSNCTAGGNYSTASGYYSTAPGSYSTASGHTATAQGDYSVAHGRNSTASGNASTASGSASTASGDYSTASGSNCTAGGNYSTASGSSSSASRSGQASHANGRFVITGDAQLTRLVARTQTTDATATELAIDGSSLYLTIDATRTMSATIHIAAHRTDVSGTAAAWPLIQVGITRNSTGNCRLLGAVSGAGTTTLCDAGASTWNIAITADTTNNRLAITATGEAGKTIRWVATVDMAEVG